MKDVTITLFKNLFKSKGVPYTMPLYKIVERIRSGKSKDLIKQIRGEKEPKEYKKLKEQLPAILFSGEFTQRNAESCKQHSGLMVLDYDQFESEEYLNKTWESLTTNKFVVFVFISPGGNGIKALVNIPPCDKADHTRYFKQFASDYPSDYFDAATSDICRVCFESYDPNCYVNYKAEQYDPGLVDEGFRVSEKVPLIMVNDEGEIIERIMGFNWGKDFADGQRNNFIFDIAGAFCEYGVSEITALGYINNNVVHGKFTAREAETTIKSAYKKRKFESKYFEDYDKANQVRRDLSRGFDSLVDSYNIDRETYEIIKENIEHEDFWYMTGKDLDKVKIDAFKFKLFLERNGFGKYFPNGGQKPIFVKIQSNKVSLSSVEKVKDFTLGYLQDNSYFKVWSYAASYTTLFTEKFLTMLETVELMMLKDTRYNSYMAFSNGILNISDKSSDLVDYIDVDGYIWESHIIDREFTPVVKCDNDYKTFVKNISDNTPLPIEVVIGYLLTRYKNKTNNRAIILNDEVISENPEGGTGKGLFIQGITKIRKAAIIDGKSFDDSKAFAYQTVSEDDSILVFDDIRKNFNLESKFSIITEGLTIEYKGVGAIKMKIEESPKIVITTNYAVKGAGNSHDRRRHEIEIAQYYNKDLTPHDEFKRNLFDDWNAEEFNRFDNYMVQCLQKYLKHGLIDQDGKNIETRRFIAETAMEFREFCEDATLLPRNVRNDKTQYFEAFVNEYPDFKKWLSRKMFNAWLQEFSNYKGWHFDQGNTNGSRWFRIENSDKKSESEIMEDLPF